ncbi:MAG: serine protease [Bacteroidota bacterium]
MKQATILLLVLFSTLTFGQGLDPTEFLINNTIKIECGKTVNGKKVTSSGTGFFFTFNWNNNEYIPVLVTNKHVIKGATNAILYFKEWDSTRHPIYGRTIKITVNFENAWISHPDTTVDLAVLPMRNLSERLKKDYKDKIQYPGLNESNLLTDSIAKSITAIEDVYMIGYPYGLRDEVNDIPIVRKGITATPLFLNYKGKKEFLVDMPVYKGSSGSPVIIYSNTFRNRNGEMNFGQQRVLLVGINFATYYKTFEGKLVPRKTDSLDSLQVQTSLPLYNIGIVIKAERLLDFKGVFAELEKKVKK